MPYITSNQKLGKLGKYLSKQRRNRDNIHSAWKQNGSAAIRASPVRCKICAGSSTSFEVLSDLSLLAVTVIDCIILQSKMKFGKQLKQ